MLNICHPQRLLKGSCEHFLFFFLLKVQSSSVTLSSDFAFREFEDVLWDPTHKTHGGKKTSKTQAQQIEKVLNPTLERGWVEISWIPRKMFEMHKFSQKASSLKPHPHHPWTLDIFLSLLICSHQFLLCTVLPDEALEALPIFVTSKLGNWETSKGTFNS